MKMCKRMSRCSCCSSRVTVFPSSRFRRFFFHCQLHLFPLAPFASKSITALPKAAVVEAMDFMTKDYRKRFQAALALLTDMYVADVAAAAAAAAAAQAAKQEKGKAIKRPAKLPKPRGFDLYDEALLSLLTTLSQSLEPTWRQKLFTQTLLECPRVPPAALELVCTLCDLAAQPHDVQTGEGIAMGWPGVVFVRFDATLYSCMSWGLLALNFFFVPVGARHAIAIVQALCARGCVACASGSVLR